MPVEFKNPSAFAQILEPSEADISLVATEIAGKVMRDWPMDTGKVDWLETFEKVKSVSRREIRTMLHEIRRES